MLTLDDERLTEEVLAAIAAAGRPLAAREVQDALGAESKVERERLNGELVRLVAFGRLHLTAKRYWDIDAEQVLADAARRILEQGPVTRAQWVAGLRRAVPFASEAACRDATFAAARAPDVRRWPGRPQRFSVLPTPVARVSDPRAQLDALVAQLERKGESREAIARRIWSAPAPAAAVPDGMAFQLVLAWRDFRDPSTREALERLMLFAGLVRLGAPGEAVGFDGIRHDTDDDLWPDDPAVIEVPGWGLVQDGFVRVLEKSVVRAAQLQSKGAC